MPYSGSGGFNREYRWVNDLAAHIPITASRMDDEQDDFALGFASVICKDGQTTTIARIPFASGVGIASGSLAAPGLNFTSSANSGLRHSTGSTWQLVAGGVAVVTLTPTMVTIPVALSLTGTFGITGATTLTGPLTVNGNFAVNAGTTILTTSDINAFAVGRQGSTRPAFHVNAAAALSDTGIDIVSRAAGGGVDISATGGGNVAIRMVALGTGSISLGSTGTGSISLGEDTTVSGTFNATGAATLSSTLVVADQVTMTGSGLYNTVTNNSTLGADWRINHIKTGVGANNDVILNWDFFAEDSGGSLSHYGKMEAIIATALAANEDGMFRWRVARGGGLQSKLVLSGALDALHPAGNTGATGLALGTASFRWTALHLDNASEINFFNSNLVLTHSSNKLTLTGSPTPTLLIKGHFSVTDDFTVTAGTGVVNCVGGYRVNGTQVVTVQQSAVANATGSGDAHTQLNILLTRLRAHGLIDT